MNYQRTGGASGGVGFRYETKVTAFIALRLYNNTDEFYLANDCASGGKFDDLVFSARQGKKWSTSFIQLKHKGGKDKGKTINISALRQRKNKDFALPIYFNSFKSIIERFSGAEDKIFSKGFSSASFNIFTNALLHPDVISRNHEKVDVKLISTGSPQELNIKFNFEKDRDIFETIEDDPFLLFFIDKLVFCSGQYGEDEMNTLIEAEIQKASATIKLSQELTSTSTQLLEYLHNWYKKSQYLTKSDIAKVLSKTSFDSFSGNKSDLDLKFAPSFLKTYYDQFEAARGNIIHLVSKAETPQMCLAALNQMSLQSRLFLLNQLDSDLQASVKDLWNKQSMALIIDCQGTISNSASNELILFFQELLRWNPMNFVILITTTDNSCAHKVINDWSSSTKQIKKLTFNCTLKNLQPHSRSLLADRELLFQGYNTKLSSLVPKGNLLDDVFDMATMTQLILGRQASVGKKPVDRISYYITRVLMRRNHVFSKILENSDCIFAISGLSLEEATEKFELFSSLINTCEYCLKNYTPTIRIIVLGGNPSLEFAQLRKMYPKIHWLVALGNLKNLIWKQSTADVRLIRNHLTTKYEFVTTDNIMKIEDRIVVISAEPGMGKSTLLAHMAAETKLCQPDFWVVSIALNDYTDRFERPDFTRKVSENVWEILLSAAGIGKEDSKLNARLFKFCFEEGKLIVLLDGFDEVCPYYVEQASALVKELKRSKAARIWITTRPVMRDHLQDITSTLSFVIKPFGKKDQQHFLQKYWNNPNLDKENLEKFIAAVLALLEESLTADVEEFTGIPLQTRMLADVFNENLKEFAKTKEIRLPDKINICDLFQEFVKKKLEILWEEKSKISALNAFARSQLKEVNESRTKELINLALITILSQNQLSQINPPVTSQHISYLKEMVNNGNEKTGIVISFRGDVPNFIHRTFAEFFVAKFLTENFVSNRKLLSDPLFYSQSFRFVKYLFDRLLSRGYPLHEAVLEKTKLPVLQAPVFDSGNRSALHVAASLPDSQETICQLLQMGCDASKRDGVLEWLPLQYAVILGEIGNIVPLLEVSPEIPQGAVPLTWEALQIAFYGDYLKTFLYLFENQVDQVLEKVVLNEEEVSSWSYLHLGAYYNSVKILNYLLYPRKVQIDEKDGKGYAAIHYAVLKGHSKALEVLLEFGANINILTLDSKSPMELALDSKNYGLFFQILAAGIKWKVPMRELLSHVIDHLVIANTDRMNETLLALLEKYPDMVNWPSRRGDSLLRVASAKGNPKAVEALLRFGANPVEKNRFGTAIDAAATYDRLEILNILLSHVKLKKAEDLRSAMFSAVKRGRLEILKLLITHGADLNLKSDEGETLFHALANSSSISLGILDLLSKARVDFRATDKKGESGIDALRKRGYYISENMLIDKVTDNEKSSNQVQEPSNALMQKDKIDENNCPNKKKSRKKKALQQVEKKTEQVLSEEMMIKLKDILNPDELKKLVERFEMLKLQEKKAPKPKPKPKQKPKGQGQTGTSVKEQKPCVQSGAKRQTGPSMKEKAKQCVQGGAKTPQLETKTENKKEKVKLKLQHPTNIHKDSTLMHNTAPQVIVDSQKSVLGEKKKTRPKKPSSTSSNC